MPKLCADELALAVMTAFWVVVTDAAFAVNDAAEAPGGMTTLEGMVRAPALLASATAWPPVAAGELSDTEQDVEPAPVNVFRPHDNALTLGAEVVPLPVRSTETVGALLDEIVICPATAPAVRGLN